MIAAGDTGGAQHCVSPAAIMIYIVLIYSAYWISYLIYSAYWISYAVAKKHMRIRRSLLLFFSPTKRGKDQAIFQEESV